MKMTDEAIRRDFERAADKKKQVKILADQNGVGVWEMMEKLQTLKTKGLDGRWYQNLNPARQGDGSKAEFEKTVQKPTTEDLKPTSEKVAYLKKIIQEQDRQLKEGAAEREELKKKIDELAGELAEKSDRLDAAEEKLFGLAGAVNAERTEKETLTRELAEAREICETQIEMIRKKDAEIADLRAQQGVNATSRLRIIRWFCKELTGPAAYLMGRIVENLLAWRETGSAEELREFLDAMMEDDESEN